MGLKTLWKLKIDAGCRVEQMLPVCVTEYAHNQCSTVFNEEHINIIAVDKVGYFHRNERPQCAF